mgnify:CR=1 FL=1
MKIGIFQSMLTKYGIEETAQKIRENNLDAVQLYFSFNGVQISSKELIEDRELCERIRSAFANEGVEISGLCGYQNLVNPDEAARGNAVEELKRYIELCERFDTNLVVTEVGSANPESNWADHPNNYTAEILNLAAQELQELCDYAAKFHVAIGIEPHFAQVAKNPKSIRRILDLVKRENLKVIFDPANLINSETADRADELLEELFALNGNDIALLHAKDTKIVKGKAVFVAAGTGVLNYTLYGQLAKKYGYRKPVILEYMSEAAIPAAREVVERAFQG